MPSAMVSARRGDAAVAGVDLDRLHALLLGLVVGEADPAERRLGALDALDDEVVVGARRVVGAGRLVLARAPRRGRRWRTRRTCRTCRAPRRARRCRAAASGKASAYADSTSVGQLGVVAPVGEALGLRPDERVQRRHVEAGDRLVGRVRGDREAVDGDLQLDVLDAARLAGGDLLVVDRPGGVGDVGAALAERGEAVTRAGALDGDRQVAAGQLAGELADADADRLDGRRPGHEDLATGELDVTAGSAGPSCRHCRRWCRSALVGRAAGRRSVAAAVVVGAAVSALGPGRSPRSWRRRRHRRRRTRRGRACRRSPRRTPCGGRMKMFTLRSSVRLPVARRGWRGSRRRSGSGAHRRKRRWRDASASRERTVNDTVATVNRADLRRSSRAGRVRAAQRLRARLALDHPAVQPLLGVRLERHPAGPRRAHVSSVCSSQRTTSSASRNAEHLVEPVAVLGVLDRHEHLDAPVEVARHHVGRPDQVQRLRRRRRRGRSGRSRLCSR